MANQPIKIVFAGTPEFASPILKALIKDNRFEVAMVVTQPDKPGGRKGILTSPPVKTLAVTNGIVVKQPEKIADIEDKLNQIKPDLFVVAAYGQILPESILKIPAFGAINVHASLLPSYRGASPIQEAILRGDKKTGITFQLMNKFLDQGDIVEQIEITIGNDDSYPLLAKKLSGLTASLLPDILARFVSGKITSVPQDSGKATYCRKISKEDGLLDFQKESAESMVRKVRAYNPWPGCFTFLNGKRIKINSAAVGEQKIDTGECLKLKNNRIGIGTKKGAFLPLTLQPEGKKEITASEFVRGYMK